MEKLSDISIQMTDNDKSNPDKKETLLENTPSKQTQNADEFYATLPIIGNDSARKILKQDRNKEYNNYLLNLPNKRTSIHNTSNTFDTTQPLFSPQSSDKTRLNEMQSLNTNNIIPQFNNNNNNNNNNNIKHENPILNDISKELSIKRDREEQIYTHQNYSDQFYKPNRFIHYYKHLNGNNINQDNKPGNYHRDFIPVISDKCYVCGQNMPEEIYSSKLRNEMHNQNDLLNCSNKKCIFNDSPYQSNNNSHLYAKPLDNFNSLEGNFNSQTLIQNRNHELKTDNGDSVQNSSLNTKNDKYYENKSRMEKMNNLSFKTKMEALNNEKIVEWNPWGKQGAGAPLRDNNGRIIADLRKFTKSNNNEPNSDVQKEFSKMADSNFQKSPNKMDEVEESKDDEIISSPISITATSSPVIDTGKKNEYSEYLKFQIKEKKRKKRDEEEVIRKEEEKEALRIQQEQEKIKKAYEEEISIQKQKDLEIRNINEELNIAARKRKEMSKNKTELDNNNNSNNDSFIIDDAELKIKPAVKINSSHTTHTSTEISGNTNSPRQYIEASLTRNNNKSIDTKSIYTNGTMNLSNLNSNTNNTINQSLSNTHYKLTPTLQANNGIHTINNDSYIIRNNLYPIEEISSADNILMQTKINTQLNNEIVTQLTDLKLGLKFEQELVEDQLSKFTVARDDKSSKENKSHSMNTTINNNNPNNTIISEFNSPKFDIEQSYVFPFKAVKTKMSPKLVSQTESPQPISNYSNNDYLSHLNCDTHFYPYSNAYNTNLDSLYKSNTKNNQMLNFSDNTNRDFKYIESNSELSNKILDTSFSSLDLDTLNTRNCDRLQRLEAIIANNSNKSGNYHNDKLDYINSRYNII